MALVNDAAREISVKLVYYGPALGGKTSNLQYIHNRTDPARRERLISFVSEIERTLSFSFVPATLGALGGYQLRLHLYTVPGTVFYGASHERVLKGADGIVFVADSQAIRGEANVGLMADMFHTLETHGVEPASVPLVLQYNKRDLPDILPVEALDRVLNPRGVPRFEASAFRGEGVFDTLKACARLVVERLRKESAGGG